MLHDPFVAVILLLVAILLTAVLGRGVARSLVLNGGVMRAKLRSLSALIVICAATAVSLWTVQPGAFRYQVARADAPDPKPPTDAEEASPSAPAAPRDED